MPFEETDSIHLDEMLDAAGRLKRHLAQTAAQTFESDALAYDAVCMCLLRIGEGARLLSDAAKAELPGVPWPDVVNLRHRIAHGYSYLRASVIWVTAAESVPALADALTSLRARIG